MNDDLSSLIYNKSLDLISRREHSRGELYIKLIKRYPDAQELINETLDKLNLNKLLDDARFAEMYVMAITYISAKRASSNSLLRFNLSSVSLISSCASG